MRTKESIIQINMADLKDFIHLGLTKIEYQLIFHLLSQADELNLVRLNRNEVIAKELNSTIRSITRSIIKLQNCNLIRKTTYKGGRIFMINPNYFYMGKSHHALSSIYEQL